MQTKAESLAGKVCLITGAAHRVGAAIVRNLHAEGMNIVLHYRNSLLAAQDLKNELETNRPDSVFLLQGDLSVFSSYRDLIADAAGRWSRLDLLINNASSFYPTPVGETGENEWDDLMASNLKAPYFLSQAAMPHLQQSAGNIVNIVDIHAERPLKNYPVYSMAKAGLVMLTRSLAKEMGPAIRVNAVAPGAILWPEGFEDAKQKEILSRTALKRKGDPNDIAKAVLYLVRDAGYTTGQILAVDGGRSLNS